ncbi:InlB B-repeat-containing protein [Clostridiales bacterium]|nr:InlB B-repeat-containing protein [Clostridiales bacterium]
MNNEYYSMKKRLLAIVMSLMMIFQMIPAGAFAAGEGRITSQPLRAGAGTYHISFKDIPAGDNFVPAGNMINNPAPDPDPAPEGQQFIGWYCEAVGVWFSTQYRPTSDMEFVPKYGWEVRFRNHNGDVIETKQVPDGEAIGDLPAVPARDDYKDGYWGIGIATQTGQSAEWSAGEQVTSDYVVGNDLDIVAGYKRITYTITFYTNADKTETVTIRTVDADTHYCVNDLPAVPEKAGYTGKWVYYDKKTNTNEDYNNQVAVSEDTAVWAAYDQNVFTVTFKTGDDVYQTGTYYIGDELILPADPVIEGKQFEGWYVDETEYVGGEEVTSDLVLDAQFIDMFSVTFIVENGGEEQERLSQFFRTGGEAIATMPQDPFVAGKAFEKWVIKGTDTEVTADTVVNGDMVVVAKFRTVTIYDITAEYYYLNNRGVEVIFNTDLLQVEAGQLPYTITAPSSTQTDPDEVPGAPIYYPETPTVTVEEDDFNDDNECTVRIKYVKYTAEYDFVYMLKDLEGDGYSEIERKHIYGVLNSYVTPSVNTYDYATLELAEGTIINQAEGQELKVYYTRKQYQLTYETNGGSYVGGATVPYGTEAAVSSTVPTRTGYTFAGWYIDADLTQSAGSTVTIEENTTLYAKWTGDTVNYSIVYLFEKYNDAGTASSFVYENSETGSGTVGETVYATDGTIPDKTKAGWVKDDTQNASSSVEIAADGSSVLYVYYKLREYTFIFNGGTYTQWYTYNVEATLTGKNVTGTGTLNYTITVKLGQDISSAWPGNVTGRYNSGTNWWPVWNNVSFNGWYNPQEQSRYVTKRTIVTPEMLPNSGTSITYTAQWTGNAYTYTVNYWLQNADDDGYTKSEEYSQTYTSSGGNLGAKEIAGYTYDHGNSGAQNVTQYDFYYNRDTFQIDYFYGSTNLDTIENIKFDANINKAPYVWTPTAAQCGVDSDYTFGGWYSNSGLTAQYTFSTMPATNVVLYAKWTAPSYTVSFVDGDNPSTEMSDSQTVEKYKRASAPTTSPTKEGYTFDGWYSTADGDTLFDWNTQITEDTTVYAHWTKATLSYTVRYVDEEGNPVADDKNVSNPNLTVDQNITEQAIAVAGYRPQDASQTLKLSDDISKNVLVFVYSEKAETTSYKVYYILDPNDYPDEDIAVAAAKTVENVPGDTASVIELAAAVDYDSLIAAHPEFEGYEFFPDEVEKTLTLTATAEQNSFYFYYSKFKSATVTVRFVDMDGNAIADEDTQILKIGKTYTLSRTPITGWALNKAVVGTNYNGDDAGSTYKITTEIANNGLIFTLFYQKKLTITAVNRIKPYDGTALKIASTISDQVTIEGLLSDKGHTLASIGYTYSGADNAEGDGRENAGVATVTPENATISGASENYYQIRYISGTLEVTKINVTVRVEPDRWTGNVYDGTVRKAGFTNNKSIDEYVIISHDGYKTQYLNDIWATVVGKATYDATAGGHKYYGIAEADAGDYTYFENVLTLADLPQNDNYSVNLYVRPGRLEIKPKPVTITTGSATKVYDGTALTKEDGYTVDGIVEGETYGLEITGSQTEVGNSLNSYIITWAGENEYTAKAKNYSIIDNLGILTINDATLSITIKNKTTTYNGSEQNGYAAPETVTGTGSPIDMDEYTITGLAEGDVLEVTGYEPSFGTDASIYTNGSFDEATISISRNGTNVTSNYEITTNAGGLTINPVEIELTADSATKEYDGTALTKNTYKITKGAFVGEEGLASVTVEGSQTVVGKSANTITGHTLKENTEAENYTIAYKQGELEVTKASVEITITAGDGEQTYNGNALTNTEVTVTSGELLEGDELVATATGSATNVADTAEGNNPIALRATRSCTAIRT